MTQLTLKINTLQETNYKLELSKVDSQGLLEAQRRVVARVEIKRRTKKIKPKSGPNYRRNLPKKMLKSTSYKQRPSSFKMSYYS